MIPMIPMKQSDSIEYNIGTHYLAALINADLSGLADEEAAALDEFEYQVKCDTPAGFEFGHFIAPTNHYDDFKMCEVSGLMASTVPVTAIYWAK